MTAMQQRKGKRGEQELAGLLREHLGAAIARNLSQCHDGGCDLVGLPGNWALECKRTADHPRLETWWEQCCRQAEKAGLRPALAYRMDRHPWRVIVALRHVAAGFEHAPLSLRLETDLETFAAIVREGCCTAASPKMTQPN